jgi:hypothetical protein
MEVTLNKLFVADKQQIATARRVLFAGQRRR